MKKLLILFFCLGIFGCKVENEAEVAKHVAEVYPVVFSNLRYYCDRATVDFKDYPIEGTKVTVLFSGCITEERKEKGDDKLIDIFVVCDLIQEESCAIINNCGIWAKNFRSDYYSSSITNDEIAYSLRNFEFFKYFNFQILKPQEERGLFDTQSYESTKTYNSCEGDVL